MIEREFDHREFTPDEQRVLDIIEEMLGVKYIGNLWVKRTRDMFTRKEDGYQLIMTLNNLDKPYYITYMGDDKEEFFRLVRTQLREDNIPSKVMYSYGQMIEPVKEC